MEIKKADSKGRVTLNVKGTYEVIRKPNGVIELWPVYSQAQITEFGPQAAQQLADALKQNLV